MSIHDTDLATAPKSAPHHTEYLRRPWADALKAYQDTGDALGALAHLSGDDAERVVAACDNAAAFKRLIATPVPDLDALREKVRILRSELGLSDDFGAFHSLLVDIDRLN